ncbi:hypothetical protein ACLOJK_026284 [Asimina triloba]
MARGQKSPSVSMSGEMRRAERRSTGGRQRGTGGWRRGTDGEAELQETMNAVACAKALEAEEIKTSREGGGKPQSLRGEGGIGEKKNLGRGNRGIGKPQSQRLAERRWNSRTKRRQAERRWKIDGSGRDLKRGGRSEREKEGRTRGGGRRWRERERAKEAATMLRRATADEEGEGGEDEAASMRRR